MKFEFTDSNGTYYTFNPVDYADQLEVGAPDRRGIPIVQIRFKGPHCEGVVNVSYRDNLRGLGFLCEEARHYFVKCWENRVFA